MAAVAPRLTLTARSDRGEAVVSRDVGAEGVTIGRAPDCGLQLPDPDRYVSARHAVIEFVDDTFRLTDTSSNGTFVNGRDAPLGAGERHLLRHGDQLGIGLYKVQVTAPAEARVPPVAVPVGAPAGTTVQPAPDLAGRPGLPPLPSFAGLPATPRFDLEQALPARPPSPPADTLLASVVTGLLADRPTPGTVPGAAPGAAAPPRPRRDEVALFTPVSPEASAGLPASPFAAFGIPDPPPAAAPAGPAGTPPVPQPMLAAAAPAGPAVAPAAERVAERPAGPMAEPVAEPVESPPLFPPPLTAGVAEPRAADAATNALAAFWAGCGFFPSDLRADELPVLMRQLGTALREACDGVESLLAEAGRSARHRGGVPERGQMSRLLSTQPPTRARLDDVLRDAITQVARRQVRRDAAAEAGLRRVTELLSARALAGRYGPLVSAIRPRRRHAEFWRLFVLMETELRQIAEHQFHEAVADHLAREDGPPRLQGTRP